MIQKEKAIESFNILKEFLEKNDIMPYHEARYPPQFIKSFRLDKKSDTELISMIDLKRLDELIKRDKSKLSWNTVAEVSEEITNILYLLSDRQEKELFKGVLN